MRILKNIKLHTVLAYYFLTFCLLYNLIVTETFNLDIFIIILISFIIFSEIILIVLVLNSVIKDDVFPSSLLLKQLIVLLTGLFALQFFNPLIYLLIVIGLYIALRYSTKRYYCQTSRRTYYILHYRHKSLPYVIYIGYGVLTYYLLWLSNPTILSQQALLLLYNAFYPYIIVILIVLSHTLDRKTDYANSKLIATGRKTTMISNLILIVLEGCYYYLLTYLVIGEGRKYEY